MVSTWLDWAGEFPGVFSLISDAAVMKTAKVFSAEFDEPVNEKVSPTSANILAAIQHQVEVDKGIMFRNGEEMPVSLCLRGV